MNSRKINFDAAYRFAFDAELRWTKKPEVVAAKRKLFDAMQNAASEFDWDETIPHAEHQRTMMNRRDHIRLDKAVRAAAADYDKIYIDAELPVFIRQPMSPPPSNLVLYEVVEAMKGNFLD